MKISVFFATVSIFCFINLTAQDKYFDLAASVQQYPTGFLLGVEAQLEMTKHHALDVRIGYNFLDHKDFGVHQSEKGGGLGFSLGYRYYFNPENQAWFIGVDTDLWWNEVDWVDNINLTDEMMGVSNIIVFQPTIIGGYVFLLNDGWVIAPS